MRWKWYSPLHSPGLQTKPLWRNETFPTSPRCQLTQRWLQPTSVLSWLLITLHTDLYRPSLPWAHQSNAIMYPLRTLQWPDHLSLPPLETVISLSTMIRAPSSLSSPCAQLRGTWIANKCPLGWIEFYVVWTASWTWTVRKLLFKGQPVAEKLPWWSCLYMVSVLSVSSHWWNSINCGSKIFGSKYICIQHVQTCILCVCSLNKTVQNNLHSIHIFFSIFSNLEVHLERYA